MRFPRPNIHRVVAKCLGQKGVTVCLARIDPTLNNDAMKAWIGKQGFAGKYEWFYLPRSSFRTRENEGRVFIHFGAQKLAQSFISAMNGHAMPNGDVLSASISPTQGLRATRTESLKQRIQEWTMEVSCPGEVTLEVTNLDDECKKGDFMEVIDGLGFAGTYDFLYVSHGGFATINITSAEAAQAFVRAMHGKVVASGRALNVKISSTQGLRSCLTQWWAGLNSRQSMDLPYVKSAKKSGNRAAPAGADPRRRDRGPNADEAPEWASPADSGEVPVELVDGGLSSVARLSGGDELDWSVDSGDEVPLACLVTETNSADELSGGGAEDVPDEGSGARRCPALDTGSGHMSSRAMSACREGVASSRFSV